VSNHFKIIVPFYNVSRTISKTVNSALLQEYDNYHIYLIDDMSTDDSAQVVESIKSTKITFIKNNEKKHSLRNIYETIHNHTFDEDIVLILDGDDFLYNKQVLSTLDRKYNDHNCWLTYGSYINLSTMNRGKFATELPKQVIESNTFRDYKWCTSHLRTFRSFLFKQIKTEDLKDDNGNFFTITGDLAIMFPMLEMSRERSLYIHDLLYIWNDLNELNDHKKDNKLQVETEMFIRGLNKYDRYIR